MTVLTDRIEKEIDLDATPSRVWRALTNTTEFCEWFGVKLHGEFVPGKSIRGEVSCSGYEGTEFEMRIERMDAESLFSYRWHPHAVDGSVDYSSEPMTLVEFRLEPLGTGTRLRVVESGFDQLPESRREEAFRMNDGGWTQQIENVASYVSPS